ncbi:MAG: hypothetical protein AAB019_09905 [Planctomycetota bacterium]
MQKNNFLLLTLTGLTITLLFIIGGLLLPNHFHQRRISLWLNPVQAQPLDEKNNVPEKTGGGDAPARDVLKTMSVQRKTDYITIKQVKPEEILVIQGDKKWNNPSEYYDRVQDVLDALEIPYTLVEREKVRDQDFQKIAAVICNCVTGGVDKKGLVKIKDFVAQGGYFFSTDWCLATVIPHVANGYIKTGVQGSQHINAESGPSEYTEEVSVQPFEKNKNHIFLRDVFPKADAVYKWVLDDEFQTFKVVKPDDVTVLIVGDAAMLKKYKTNMIAACWTVDGKGGYNPLFSGYKGESSDYLVNRGGKGVMLYVASHFAMQNLGHNDLKGNSSMYQLIANFILDAKLAKQFRESQPANKDKKKK